MARQKKTIEPGTTDLAAHSLAMARQQFMLTLNALEEFLEVLTPHVEELDSSKDQKLADLFENEFGHLTPDELKAVSRDLAKAGAVVGEVAEQVKPSSRRRKSKQTTTTPIGRKFSIHPESARLLMRAADHFMAPPRLPILLNALLPMAIGAFEVLVGRLAGVYYVKRPGVLDASNKEFSLDDLLQFDSIEDARKDAIERRVEALLIQGLDEWSKWFSRKGLDINLSQLSVNWNETVELFQRRHIIVHNAGRVSKRYLDRLSPLYSSSDLPALGTEPPISTNYVQAALDNVLVLGHLTCAFMERNLFGKKEGGDIGGDLHSLEYKLMRAGKWQPAKKVCQVAQTIKEVPEATRLKSRCGEWLCDKNLSGLEAVQASITDWDTSTLGLEYKAIKSVLLDRHDDAIDLLVIALNSGQVHYGELRDSPFFRNLVGDVRLRRNRSKTAHESPSDPEGN